VAWAPDWRNALRLLRPTGFRLIPACRRVAPSEVWQTMGLAFAQPSCELHLLRQDGFRLPYSADIADLGVQGET